MPRRIARIALAWLLLLAAACGAAEILEGANLRRDIIRLASDRYQGRMTGDEGGQRAAAYLARRLSEIGLAPLGDDGYLQWFDVVTGHVAGPDSSLRWDGVELRQGRDARPAPFSASASLSAEAVFVGYGIPAGDLGLDDYAGLDVKGKVAVVLSGAPGAPGARPELASHARARRKVSFAAQSGAVAVLYLATEGDLGADVIPEFPADNARTQAGIPFVALSRDAALRLLPPEYADVLAEAEGAVEAHRGDRLGTVSLRADVRAVTKRAANLVGRIEGSDPALRGECVVIGAHYDHIGMGAFAATDDLSGREVHNGADDNASGAAGALALAEALVASPPRRSVVVVLFTGEELGLLGSRHYVDHPAAPLEQTVAMVNLDMVGRLREGQLWVFGTQTSPGFGELARSLAGEIEGLALQPSDSAPAGSDHTSFLTRGIPSLFFFTGLHAEYHSARDDWPLINFAGERAVLTLAEGLIRAIGDNPERPSFVAPSAAPASGSPGRREGVRVTLGTMPDFGAMEQPGYHVGGVAPGGPADQAGLRAGDIVVRFGEDPVADIEDFMAALMRRRPGEQVELTVERGADTLRLLVTLGERKAE